MKKALRLNLKAHGKVISHQAKESRSLGTKVTTW